VVAAECCYGAELYDPTLSGGQQAICNTYLAGGAYGFFGSSTIAYGPSSGNGSADLICQYFLQQVLNGASLGRAALAARQTFVAKASPLDPSDLKTLGQFSLLGDPSIHPVEAAKPALTKTAAYAKALPDAERKSRKLRRAHLEQAGEELLATPFAEPAVAPSRGAKQKSAARPKAKIRAALAAAAGESKLAEFSVSSFTVAEPREPASKGMPKGSPARPSAFHVAVGRPARQDSKVSRIVLIIATEVDGNLAALRRLHAR
jgi:hypothetical protein